MTGFTFCKGMKMLLISRVNLKIRPVIHLIELATSRPKYTTVTRPLLGIGDIGELINMFRFHKASDIRDKIYALLGMMYDDVDKPSISPDYTVPWETLFQRTACIFFGETASIRTWNGNETAVIVGKGLVIGKVVSVSILDISSGRQIIRVHSDPCRGYKGRENQLRYEWTTKTLATPVLSGDIVSLLLGAHYPCVLRPQANSFFQVIMVGTAMLRQVELGHDRRPRGITWGDWSSDEGLCRHNFLLVWRWDPITYDSPHYDVASERRNNTATIHPLSELSKVTELENAARILVDCNRTQEALEGITEAITILAGLENEICVQARSRLHTLEIIYANQEDWEHILETYGKALHNTKVLTTPSEMNVLPAHFFPDDFQMLDYIKTNTESVILQEIQLDRKWPLVLLLRLLGDTISLTTNILEALATHPGSLEILESLFERGDDFKITYNMLRSEFCNNRTLRSAFQRFIGKRSEQIAEIAANTDICKVAAVVDRLSSSQSRILDSLGTCCDVGDRNALEKVAELYTWAFQLDEDAVRELVGEKVDLDIPNEHFESILLKASGEGHLSIATLLLESARVDVNYTDRHKITPLYVATANLDAEMCTLLLQYGANPRLTTEFGDSPMDLAKRLEQNSGVLSVFENVMQKDEFGRLLPSEESTALILASRE
jgi:hypothetical protein